METFLIALGLVAVIEGLVLALAPSRFIEIVRMLEEMSIEQRRMLGLCFMAGGVGFIWVLSLF